MKLLINEWRKYLFNVRSVIIIPLILLIILIIYFSTIGFIFSKTTHSLSVADCNKAFFHGISICYYFINFIAIIYASNILSSEISRGTIKFILTRPYQRYKILLAKIGAITILMPVMLIIFVIITLLLQLLTLHHLPELSIIIKYTKICSLYILGITVFFTAFALMLSSLTSSPAFVTGCCIVYYFFAAGLWALINLIYLDLPTDGWLYKLCPLNINSYLFDLMKDAIENSAQNEFYIALLANITYACIFVLIAVLIFRRRDISLAN
ncbi:ABC transporter permease subunit [Snodgrassella communis]|uniref:ABC transporter permease subunit n=1 Tax=Snodgrassella communis TaxID=2946699 RepID=UPI001EF5307C|nr:ABC transporter permease subunit [Snodgrassella communis]